MVLLESGEMYLETILVLSKKSPYVRAVDISEYMGFSKPSVSRALAKLKEYELVNVDQNGAVTLTPAGKKTAQKIYTRHIVLSEFLVKIGVKPEIASHDACLMEHDISDETLEAIKKHLEDMK